MENVTVIENRVDTEPSVVVWKPATKIAFRFAFGLFGLFIFPFPLSYIPYVSKIFGPYEKLWDKVIPWVGKHILRIGYDILRVPTGSGDTTWGWVQACCILALAVIATIVWSILDRKRPNYTKLYQWSAIVLRYSLAAAMFGYGLDKVFPLQMPSPRLSKLIEPYGDSSPMGILWTFIGASKGYEIFTGAVETIAGLLLIVPRTAMLGAMLSAAAMFQVWMLNMCYDVPVKLYSFQLLLQGIFLMAPMLPRLADLLIFQRPAQPRPLQPLFNRAWANRTGLAVQILFGLFLFGSSAYTNYGYTKSPFGYLAEKPPLYGIWDMNDLTIDGQAKPPLVTDGPRWRRMIFQTAKFVTVQPMDGPMESISLDIDTNNKTMALTKPKDTNWKADLTYQQPSREELVVDGELDGHKVHAILARYDESKFLLTSRGFHWVQEFPFNR